MVKWMGMLLIASSLFSLLLAGVIEANLASASGLTGNVIVNILRQQQVQLNFLDYLEALAFSYSIISLLMGVIFLFRT